MKSSKYWSIVLALAAFLPMHNVSAEVVTVSNPNGGAILSELQSMGKSIQNVDSLVVTGTLIGNDYAVLNGVMTNLRWLDLSGTDIVEIPDEAFLNCGHLTDLIVPPTLESFGNASFQDSHITTISGVENVKYVVDRAFLYAHQLISIPFGNKIVSIGSCSLTGTSIYGDLVLSESLLNIGGQAFRETNITSVDFSRCNVGTIQGETFLNCYLLNNVTFSDDYSLRINRLAFANDTSLTSIRIPATVTYIEESAFDPGRAISSPRTVTMDNNVPLDININTFGTIYDDKMTLWIPKGSAKAYRELKGYLLFGNIKEHGFSIEVDGMGYVKHLDGEYVDGSVCMPIDDYQPKTFSFIPASGYEIASVSLDDAPIILTDNAYRVGADTIAGSIAVKFVPKTLQLAVTCTDGGVVKNDGNIVSNGATIYANGGEVIKLSFTPDDGYFVKSVLFNGEEVALIDGLPCFETPVMTDDATIAVEFGSPQEYADFIRIDVDKHGPGIILCNGSTVNDGSYILMQKGDSPVFTFLPGLEGSVQSLLVNSFDMVSSISGDTLALNNLAQNVEMKVDFFSAVDVHIDNPNGKLSELLSDAGIVSRKIKFLKLTGQVNNDDLAEIKNMWVLQELDLSETTLTEIPNDAFRDMGFSKISLPLTVVKIGASAFSDCYALKTVVGYDNIRILENSAFHYCDVLENFPFGTKIETIASDVFGGCNSLPKSIVMYPSLKEYGGGFAFSYEGIDTIDFSRCCFENQTISYYAFQGAKNVFLPEAGSYSLHYIALDGIQAKSIIIPTAVKSITGHIFGDHSTIRDIYMRSSVPPTTDNNPFGNVSQVTLHVPAGSADLYESKRSWCDFANIVEYGIGVKSNGHGVIYADGKRLQSDTPLFPDGDEMIIRLVPDAGYEVTQVLLDDSVLTVGLDGSYLIPAGRETGTFSVGWKLKRFGITVNYQGNGAILCGGREMTNGEVLMADSASVVRFDIAPANGYLVKNISFNGIESVVQNGGTVYVTPAISGASTLDLTFAEQSGAGGVYQFDIATGDNGAIVYRNTTLLQETSINISAGQDAIFEINPKKYYKIDSLFYNGVDVTESIVDNKFTVSNVNAAGSISVSFCADTKATVALNTEGTLGSMMFQALKDTLEWLIVTGPMNDADFSVIRNDLRHLKTLDLSGAEITYIWDGALFSSTIENVILPVTINSISCDAFKGCMLKSITVSKITPFEICESAFSNYAYNKATVSVPLGSELAYRNDSRWSKFEDITDGAVNNKDDRFEIDGHRYSVTDFENRQVKALLKTVAEYDLLPTQVQIEGMTFAISGTKLETMDSKGYIMLIADGSAGPWEGKYWYSDQKLGDSWKNEPVGDWMNLDFDDSNWTAFAGPIKTAGFGGYTDWQGENTCYWIRRSFELDSTDVIGDVIAIFDIDNDINLYINGINVHNGVYGGDCGVKINIPSTCLKPGSNVIAAQCVDRGGYAYFDIGLMKSGLDIDGLQYEISDLSASEVTLIGATAHFNNLVVPATISFVGNTYTVTSIQDNAFENDTLIQGKVTLPSTLTYLGVNAFRGCKGITSVNIPGGVKVIHECTFENCSSLVNVEFSEGLATIGGGSFRAAGITNADFPSSLKEIGDEAFAHCGGLVTISMKPNLTTIGLGAFSYCSALKSIETPSSVTTVMGAAFARCENLETAIFSEGLKNLGEWAFGESMMLKSVYLPSTLKTLGGSAFSDCRSLEKVTIGDGITVLEDGTFYRCAIDSIIIPSTVRIIKNNVFAECGSLVYVSIPEGLTAIWGGAFSNCGNLVSINLPQSLTSIGSGAFKNDARLFDLVIPESVTSIESEAFRDCRGLSSLIIPASVNSLGSNALRGIPLVKMASATPPAITSTEQFDDYTAIVIPDGAYDTYCNTPYWKLFKNQFTTHGNLTRVVNVEQDSTGSNLSVVIGEQNLPFVVGLKIVGSINSYDIMIMRNKMTLLRNLDLSEATIVANEYEYYQGCHTEDNVIGANSFRDINLCSVILPNNVVKIGSGAFYRCRYLTGIVIPDAVEYIDESSFSECGLLKTAYIGDGVKTIERFAFNECDNLTDLHLGKSLMAIGPYAFHSCDNLRNIEFGKKLLYISGDAFSDCYSLTDVVLPGSLIEIGESAFRSCSKLKEVKIPSSVKNIGGEAFSGCPLEKVYTYTIEPTSINQNTFSCYKTARLYVPATSYYNYYWNTQWSQFTELVEFNEPYEYFYLNGDYSLTDESGRIDGTPDMEMNQTSGITVQGDSIQEINTIELNYNANNGAGASIIAGDGNTAADVANLIAMNMNVNIGVDGNRWYFFCFPFDLALDSVECTSDYVFYSYDGLKRAQGLSGWVKVTDDVTTLNKGNGYIFQSSYTGVLTIHVGSEYLEFKGKSEQDILHSYESSDAYDASWNFLGNPFISYYDIQDLAKEYDAPIVVWNGNGYDVYKPGDDDYQLKPFEAFFVQKASGKSAIEFLPNYRITYNEAQNKAATHAARRAQVGTPMDLDRQLVNISIMSQDSLTDRTRIVYSVNASMDYEIGVDAAKFQADGVPQLYTLNGKTKYAINERPMGTDEIKLGYTAPKAGTYTLSVPRHDAEVEIYDNVAKSKVDFTFGDYSFQSQAGTFNDRFVVYKTGGGVTKVEDGFRLDGMTVRTVDGGIVIEGNLNGKVQVYSESGMLLAEPVKAGRVELGNGIYIIKVGDKSIKLNVLK